MLNAGSNPNLQDILDRIQTLNTEVNSLKSRDYIVEQGANYIRWNNGKQICFGIVKPSGNDQIFNITFAKPFKELPSPVITKSGQKGWNSAWAPRDWPTYLVHYDANGFRIKATDWQSGMIYPWVAIGVWK